MIGAIVGDIAGSRFEFHNHKSKDFEFLVSPGRREAPARKPEKVGGKHALGAALLKSGALASSSLAGSPEECCRFTDDTVMTLAVADALMRWRRSGSDDLAALSAETVRSMQAFGHLYPHAGYGGSFYRWLRAENPQPYNSWGNGAAMRVSACGWFGRNFEEVKGLTAAVTGVTHNHPEGLKGAEATAAAIYLARCGWPKDGIRAAIVHDYYRLDFALNGIRTGYRFDVSCQGSVPQALEAFFESEDFEDAIRNAISIGGDSDTIGAICGAVAGAYYGVPDDIRAKAITFLPQHLLDVLREFESVSEASMVGKTCEMESECAVEIDAHADESVLRFLKPQEDVYESALTEIKSGFKSGHWIWYIFPQIRGLGHSYNSEYYGIADLAEARAYWRNPVLRERLCAVTDALLAHAGKKSVDDIFGSLDALKVRSCMTLFSLVGDARFGKALDVFYGGERDGRTLSIVKER